MSVPASPVRSPERTGHMLPQVDSWPAVEPAQVQDTPPILTALQRSSLEPLWNHGRDDGFDALHRALTGDDILTRANTKAVIEAIVAPGADANESIRLDTAPHGWPLSGLGHTGPKGKVLPTTVLHAACTWWWCVGANYDPVAVVEALLLAVRIVAARPSLFFTSVLAVSGRQPGAVEWTWHPEPVPRATVRPLRWADGSLVPLRHAVGEMVRPQRPGE